MIRVFTWRLWLHIARQLHTLLCECVAIPGTIFITNKEWENARNARHYTMHFVVLSHDPSRSIGRYLFEMTARTNNQATDQILLSIVFIIPHTVHRSLE